jgi:hypothetical protein
VHRSTDTTPQTRFRSERFFRSDGQWYFNTREGTIEGPFRTRDAARDALTQYLVDVGVRPLDVWSWGGDRR